MTVSSFCLCDWDEEIMTSSLFFFFFCKSKIFIKKKNAWACTQQTQRLKGCGCREKNGSMAAALRGFFILKTQEVSSEAGRRANRPHWASSAASTPRSVSAMWNEPRRFNLLATKTKTAKFHVVASRPASKAAKHVLICKGAGVEMLKYITTAHIIPRLYQGAWNAGGEVWWQHLNERFLNEAAL